MASQFPPKKNTAFTLYFTLYKNDGTVIANPGTITKKYSIDGAAVGDLSNAITEEDTTYGQCSIVLTAGEMNGDAIWIYIKDDTTGCVPFTATIYTAAQTLDELDAVADAVKAKTDGLSYVGTDVKATLDSEKVTVIANEDKTGYALTAAYDAAKTAAPESGGNIAAIKTKTDGLNFTGTDVKATLDGETVTVGTNNDKTGYALAADQPVNVTKIAGSAVNASSAQIGVNVVNWKGSTAVGMSGDSFAVVNNGTYGNAAIKTQLADIHDTDLPAVKADTAAILVDTGTDGVVVAAASKTGYALSAAGVQAIWDALTSALTTVGSIGKRLVDYLTGDIYARLGAPAGASVSADIAAVKVDTAATLEDTGTTLPATLTTIDNFIDTEIADIHDTLDLVHADVDAILADTNELQTDWKNGGRLDLLLDRAAGAAGAGAITWTYTVTDGTDPLKGVDVWVTSDVGGATVLARGTTNASGVVTFYLDAGTVYVWSQKSGYTFTNPDQETVS